MLSAVGQIAGRAGARCTEGVRSAALRFSGDSPVVHPGVRPFVRTDAVLLQPPAQADREAGPRRHPAPVARVVRCRQPRLRADARSRPAVLRAHSFLAGQRHRRPREAIRCPSTNGRAWSSPTTARAAPPASGSISTAAPLETEVVRDHLYKDISYRREAGDRSAGHASAHDRRPLSRQRLQERPDRRPAGVRRLPDGGGGCRRPYGAIAGDAAALAHFLARQHQPYIVGASPSCERLREEENQLVADVPEIMVMEEMPTPRPAHLLARGAYDAPGDVVSRDTPREPAAVPERSAAQSPRPGALADRPPQSARRARRRESHLAHALRPRPRRDRRKTSAARESCRPIPALLDWLAGRFMDDGWDVKALHRLIVTSETFRQSSQAPRELIAPRPRQPAARPRAEDAADGRGDSRQRARRERSPQPHDWRPERQAVSARRACGSNPARAKRTCRTRDSSSTAAASTRSGGARRRRRR